MQSRPALETTDLRVQLGQNFLYEFYLVFKHPAKLFVRFVIHVSGHATYGLTHLAILVKDLKTTLEFYKEVFDAQVMYEEKTWAQITTPGSNDIIVFEQSKSKSVGKTGGIVHFGFRLRKPENIDEMLKRVKKAGGKIKEQGEFVPGSPYVFFFDPDGYEIEIWFEMLPE